MSKLSSRGRISDLMLTIFTGLCGNRTARAHYFCIGGADRRVRARRRGARHQSNRRRIEPEDAERADQNRSRPGEAQPAEGGATKEPRDEKDEDASQERREKRDGVEEGAARQRRAGRRVAAGCF